MRLLKISRFIITGFLLLITFGFIKLLNYKEGWEMGESFAFILYIMLYIYFFLLLACSFFVKSETGGIIMFVFSLLPFSAVLLFILCAIITH